MGVAADKGRAPWWLTWALLGGLALVFTGVRIVGHVPKFGPALAGLGALIVVGATIWRAIVWGGSQGDRRKVELIFLLGYLGCTIALVLYGTTGGGDALSFLKVTLSDEKSQTRFVDGMGAFWPLLLGIALLPTLGAQLADETSRRGARAQAYVDAYRVGEAAAGGLTIAFAAGALFLLCYVASERDHKWDFSYFKTSSAGTATASVVKGFDAPVKALLFFPASNEVADEVEDYMRQLAAQTGKLTVERQSRYAAAKMAKDYKVTKEGTIVLVKGERSENVVIGSDMATARPKLKTLDEEVQKAAYKLLRAAGTVYMTVGHGEMNDPGPNEAVTEPPGLRAVAVLKLVLQSFNLKVKDIGMANGLATGLPEDCGVLLVLGPKKPFMPEELEAIDKFLAGGGALVMSLDPGTEFLLGPLADRLGVRYDNAAVTDDKQFVPARREKSDRRWVVTDQFSSHASVTTLSKSRVNSGLLAIESGSWVDAGGTGGPKKTFVVRTRATSWADADGNFEYDGALEKKQAYNLVAVVEGAAPPKDAKDAKQMRAVLLGSSTLLGDFLVAQSQLNQALAGDVLKWVAGDEQFQGKTEKETDVPIEHTKGQDAVWFYVTVIGAPLLVLAIGMTVVIRRRRRYAPSENVSGGAPPSTGAEKEKAA